MPSRIGIIIGLVLLLVFGVFTAVHNGHDGAEIPVYEVDEATMVTFQHLPIDLQETLTEEDVAVILELEFAYMKKIGLVSDAPPADNPEEVPELDMEGMAGFIKAEAARKGKTYSLNEILEVLAAEDIYLQREGIIEE